MAVIVIMDADPDYPEDWRILQANEYDGAGAGCDNRTFPTSTDADNWIQRNAKKGWCTLIVGEDD
ncbi:hypothetical protein PS870_02041 [Pseudomonas fluorescens]|uniref:Uncharacterized protein n=1 Tax=Pseudomonas fluorescens TaxID=294 RepID=A0A5E7JCD7_PSEFL|nr:hypothetical protein [Pseudomonas fluorescens]VVO85664.1 hypothetical protein PS870_02041 [Pseudomonas fluorescens]